MNGETLPQISHPEGLQLGKKVDERRTKKEMAEIGGKTDVLSGSLEKKESVE